MLVAQAKLLLDCANNVASGVEELSLTPYVTHLKIRSHSDDRRPDASQMMATEVVVDAAEFEKFEITKEEAEVTFCLKEFKAILTFAGSVSQPIKVSFDAGGRPLIISVLMSTDCNADFVLATLLDNYSQQNTSHNPAATGSHAHQAAPMTDVPPEPARAGERPSEPRWHPPAEFHHSVGFGDAHHQHRQQEEENSNYFEPRRESGGLAPVPPAPAPAPVLAPAPAPAPAPAQVLVYGSGTTGGPAEPMGDADASPPAHRTGTVRYSPGGMAAGWPISQSRPLSGVKRPAYSPSPRPVPRSLSATQDDQVINRTPSPPPETEEGDRPSKRQLSNIVLGTQIYRRV
eukprot:TRINITY_DN2373_c0_g2_i2.p1 TRINITY_DN2373_c0_g2~~TRINITY_DN2373_c0_g2_i2.p1  ORF type:complete len:399 (-),score=67.61 TRINITY_DN2373_c0_g2_i2:44-1078(-)